MGFWGGPGRGYSEQTEERQWSFWISALLGGSGIFCPGHRKLWSEVPQTQWLKE